MKIIPFEQNGYWNLKIELDGKSLNVHSIEPYRESERIASRFNPQLKYVLIAGNGMGYLVEYLLKNTAFQIIIFEHTEEIMRIACDKRNLKEILCSPRIETFYSLDELLDFIEKQRINEFNFYINRQYATLFPEIYRNLEGILSNHLARKNLNQNTLKRFQKNWLRNIIKNSFFYFDLPGIINIRHNLNNKPCVIVGAGPSLSRNIDHLKEIEKKVVIISTDTAFHYLNEKEIQVDFLVSVDPQDINSMYLTFTNPKIYPFLIADSAISFITLMNYPKEKIILYDTIFPLYEVLKNFWGEKGNLKCGGSVSTTAFDFARFLGCNPIIFIGQDLAFTQFHTHSESNPIEKILINRASRLSTFETYNARSLISADRIEIKGNVEEKVITDRKFITFLDWFKREIENTPLDVINATEGGAYIKGCQHIPLKDAIEKYGISSEINKELVILKPDSDERRRKEFQSLLVNLLSTIESLIPSCKLAINACRDILEKKTPNIFKKAIEEMNRFDFIFLKTLKEKGQIGRFIELTMQETIDKILRRGEDNEFSEEILEEWLEFYTEIYNGLNLSRHLILKRIRLEEENYA